MRRLFNRLVDPADYEGVQKKVLLDWLDRLTHAPFPHRKSAKNAPSTTGKAQDKESSV
jgi:hypothetical protein